MVELVHNGAGTQYTMGHNTAGAQWAWHTMGLGLIHNGAGAQWGWHTMGLGHNGADTQWG